MKIYYGSTVLLEKPSLETLNHKTDFGKGFYTTTDIEQAKRWTKIKKERIEEEKRENNIKRYVNIYEYSENKKLKILNFLEALKNGLILYIKIEKVKNYYMIMIL